MNILNAVDELLEQPPPVAEIFEFETLIAFILVLVEEGTITLHNLTELLLTAPKN